MRTRGGSGLGISGLYHILRGQDSDTFLSGTGHRAQIPTPTRIVPPQIQIQIQTLALAVAVVVVVVHVRERQSAVGADPSPVTPPVLVLVQAQCPVPPHDDGTPPGHSRGLEGRNASAHLQ